jgi:hypothetical protein
MTMLRRFVEFLEQEPDRAYDPYNPHACALQRFGQYLYPGSRVDAGSRSFRVFHPGIAEEVTVLTKNSPIFDHRTHGQLASALRLQYPREFDFGMKKETTT